MLIPLSSIKNVPKPTNFHPNPNKLNNQRGKRQAVGCLAIYASIARIHSVFSDPNKLVT